MEITSRSRTRLILFPGCAFRVIMIQSHPAKAADPAGGHLDPNSSCSQSCRLCNTRPIRTSASVTR